MKRKNKKISQKTEPAIEFISSASPLIDSGKIQIFHESKHLPQELQPTLAPRKNTLQGLSRLQRQVLVGCLLGDGHLRTGSGGNSYALTVLQSHAHKEYVFHLYDLFKNFCASPPKQYNFTDNRNPGKIYSRWFFSTLLYPCFRFYGLQFYKGKQKRCPPRIKSLLTPRSMAYWYMDDGAAKWQGKSLGLRFCTDNYSANDLQRMLAVLEGKHGLRCTLQKKGSGNRIYVRHGSYPQIKNLIWKHLIPEMRYKFPREY